MKTLNTALVAASLALAACGDREPRDTAATDTARATTTDSAALMTDMSRTQFAPALNVDLASMQRTPGGAYIKDLAVGTGPMTVGAGTSVTVQYVGKLSNGTQFDAGSFTFRVGAGEVVGGFEEGATGMKIGGRRLVVIPPALGYGATDYGPIPGNSVLVFTLEVKDAR